jgi:uncharacterized membrane protein HdeD (DUF308 family)
MNVLSRPGPSTSSPGELDDLRAHSGWFLALGLALIVLGALALASELTTLAVTLTFAVLLVTGGIVEIVAAFWAGHLSGFFLHLLIGIMYMVVGMLMVEQHPGVAADALTLMLAASSLIGGLLRVVVALRQRFSTWGWVLVNGIITFLLGVMIWRRWPDAAEWVIGLFVGVELIATGWSWVAFAIVVRSRDASATA